MFRNTVHLTYQEDLVVKSVQCILYKVCTVHCTRCAVCIVQTEQSVLYKVCSVYYTKCAVCNVQSVQFILYNVCSIYCTSCAVCIVHLTDQKNVAVTMRILLSNIIYSNLFTNLTIENLDLTFEGLHIYVTFFYVCCTYKVCSVYGTLSQPGKSSVDK